MTTFIILFVLACLVAVALIYTRRSQPSIANELPTDGDVVRVHYIGWYKGTEFDSSRAKNQPFTFTIGDNKVIKGWDQVVRTMKKGERAIHHIPSHLAYGTTGMPRVIPPNADLDFEIEILDIIKPEGRAHA
tara:strand:+ start:81 stop:476 length:396 start_codon:yes stop_codon:yes gene_type:complete